MEMLLYNAIDIVLLYSGNNKILREIEMQKFNYSFNDSGIKGTVLFRSFRTREYSNIKKVRFLRYTSGSITDIPKTEHNHQQTVILIQFEGCKRSIGIPEWKLSVDQYEQLVRILFKRCKGKIINHQHPVVSAFYSTFVF
jgi:hypothetical protein